MPLYHAEVYMPQVSFPYGNYQLVYSDHAVRASKNDRYGRIKLPEFVHTPHCKIIEAEINNRKIDKIVYRTPLSAHLDIVLVVIPKGNGVMFVKTVWINEKTDVHLTLDSSKYAKA